MDDSKILTDYLGTPDYDYTIINSDSSTIDSTIFTYDSSTQEFVIETSDLNMAGTYDLVLMVSISGCANFASDFAQIEVLDPCEYTPITIDSSIVFDFSYTVRDT